MSSNSIKKLYADLEAAMQYLQSGQLMQVRDRCNKILKQHPKQADALHILGMVAYESDDADMAIDLIQRAITQHDGMPAFHHHLAEILSSMGNITEAEPAYCRALELLPQYPEAMFGYANILAQTGRSAEAIGLYQQGLQIVPGDFEALCGLGQALTTVGAFQPAVEIYAAALKQQPDDADLLIAMGLAQAQLGDVDAAVSSLNHAIRLYPRSSEAHSALAKIWLDAGQANTAIEHYQCVLEADPDFAEACVGLGVCLQQSGRFDEANAQHHHALTLKPDLVSAHYNLALNKFESDASQTSIDKLQMLLKDDPPANDRIQLNFALGKRLDDSMQYDDAFLCYQQANELSNTQSFNIEAYRQSIDKLINVFTPELFANNKNAGVSSTLPILVVGMPRSGTTLIEQIIAYSGEREHLFWLIVNT
jgi:tetratricopeptide (TPR) repeat protein